MGVDCLHLEGGKHVNLKYTPDYIHKYAVKVVCLDSSSFSKASTRRPHIQVEMDGPDYCVMLTSRSWSTPLSVLTIESSGQDAQLLYGAVRGLYCTNDRIVYLHIVTAGSAQTITASSAHTTIQGDWRPVFFFVALPFQQK